MNQAELQQLEGAWVNGQPIAYLAAALGRSDLLSEPHPWFLLVTNAVPSIGAGEMEIRVLTRAGILYRSRGHRTIEPQTRFPSKPRTTVLEGTEPLVEIGPKVN